MTPSAIAPSRGGHVLGKLGDGPIKFVIEPHDHLPHQPGLGLASLHDGGGIDRDPLARAVVQQSFLAQEAHLIDGRAGDDVLESLALLTGCRLIKRRLVSSLSGLGGPKPVALSGRKSTMARG
jgi:hypothetical protein